jgi:pimeloyl-ACP methyl ester carboxylesterase
MDLEELEGYEVDYDAGGVAELPDGAKLYYEARGPEGAPTVVFVNNFFIICPLWKNFTARLAQRFRVITFDLRNQGGSTRAKDDMGIETHVADLDHLIDALGLRDVYLVGTSVSTLISRDYVLANPEKVRGLIAVGPMFNPFGGRRRKYVIRSWIRAVENGGVRALFDAMYPLIYSDRTIEAGGSATYLALRERFLALNSPAQAIKNLRASLTTRDDARKLAAITAPTLLISGEQDFYTSPETLYELQRIIPDSRAVVIPSVGHLPYFEATEEFERLVGEFVTQVEAGHAPAATAELAGTRG